MKNKKTNKQNQTSNPQDNMSNTVNSIADDSQNKNHNAKKVGMGPNTNR